LFVAIAINRILGDLAPCYVLRLIHADFNDAYYRLLKTW